MKNAGCRGSYPKKLYNTNKTKQELENTAEMYYKYPPIGTKDNFGVNLDSHQLQCNGQGHYSKSELDYINKIGPKGDKGYKGNKGNIGNKGEIGKIGPIGPVGPKGSVGGIGPIGNKGNLGPRGLQGEKGERGIKGQVGPGTNRCSR